MHSGILRPWSLTPKSYPQQGALTSLYVINLVITITYSFFWLFSCGKTRKDRQTVLTRTCISSLHFIHFSATFECSQCVYSLCLLCVALLIACNHLPGVWQSVRACARVWNACRRERVCIKTYRRYPGPKSRQPRQEKRSLFCKFFSVFQR